MRLHDTGCINGSCEYTPASTPNRGTPDYTFDTMACAPPIHQRVLTARYFYPKEIDSKSTLIFRSLPKLRWTSLENRDGLKQAWGIYLREGWNWNCIITIVVFLIVFSFIFSVSWARAKDNIQDGFAVGSWFLSLPTILVAVVAACSW